MGGARGGGLPSMDGELSEPMKLSVEVGMILQSEVTVTAKEK